MSSSQHKANILVVDDTPANLQAIEAALGDLGHQLIKVHSGQEALRKLLEHETFALVLLDIQMPDMDGFETARLIRQRKRTAHLPIIFMTAYDRDEEDLLRAYSLEAVDFLFKPIIPEVLRAKASVFVKLQEDALALQQQSERLRDLERRELERKLLREREKWEAELLREESRRKDEFLAVLAHELRNPLFPVVTGLELLRLYAGDNQELQDVRQTMESQVKHLVSLVDELLDISRISRGKISLKRVPVLLSDALKQAVDSVSPLVEDAGHHLHVECQPDLVVNADPVRLTQIAANLLNNAVRYTDKGGHIELVCRRIEGEGKAELRIADNGQGIAPEALKHIFDMFVQEKEGKQGLGLGLALVHRLVQLHQGEITVHSDGKGKGCEFAVQLPLLEHAVSSEEAPPSSPSLQALAPSTIVLIDDEAAIRSSLSALLESWGHEVFQAPQGRQGIQLIKQHQPDVAIVDISMPGIDGHEVARRVHNIMGERAPYLIALTGFGQREDREKAIAAGFHHHLTKPSSPSDLRHALSLAQSNEHTHAEHIDKAG